MSLPSWKRAFLVVAAAVTVAGCPSGYRFAVTPTDPTQVDRGLVDRLIARANEARLQWPDELRPLVHTEAAEHADLARRDLRQDPPALVDDATCARLRPVLSLVHLSDVQLKEEAISMAGPLPEGIYDLINSSAERDSLVERYDADMLMATVLGANALATPPAGNPYDPCPAPLQPQLTIHTGDAIDAGMFSEVFEFTSIMGLLDTPFFNSIGNHDNLFFGTFPADAMEGHNVVIPFVPVHTTERFMRAHQFEAAEQDISIPYFVLDVHEPSVLGRTIENVESMPATHYNGFDHACTLQNSLLCDEARGYYTIDIDARRVSNDLLRVRLISLNTADSLPTNKGEALSVRSRGQFTNAQFDWLEAELSRPSPADRTEIILIMGHHPIDSFVGDQKDRIRELLVGDDRIAAFIAGHTHIDEVRKHDIAGRTAPFWEIVGGSMLIYPQFGQIIEILEDIDDPKTFYLRLRTYRERISDLCPDLADRDDLPCRAAKARHGAERDTAPGAWRDEAAARDAANGMLYFKLP